LLYSKFLLYIFVFRAWRRCILWTGRYNDRMDKVALPMWHVMLIAQKPSYSAYPLSLITIGDQIKKRGLDLNLYLKNVANICGVNECTVPNWEKNKSAYLFSKQENHFVCFALYLEVEITMYKVFNRNPFIFN